MSLSRLFKNKNAIMVLGGFIGIAFALGFNGLTQSALGRVNDPAWIYAHYAGPDSILAQIGKAWPPALFAWRALASQGPGRIAWILANLGLGLAAVGAVAWLLGPAYARSVADFGESTLRKLGKGEARGWIARTSRRRPLLLSLLLREFRLMNREPMYLLNGPLIVVLMPVIMAVALFFQKDAMGELGAVAEVLGAGSGGMLLSAAFGAFLGASTSVTCTAVSRDAKFLPAMKALPVPAMDYMLAKLLHGLVFAVFGAVVGAVGIGTFFGIGLAKMAAAFAIALSFSSLLNLAGLWLDTAFPRLSWENPLAALKQNPNAVIAILGSMGSIGVLGWLSTRLDLGAAGFTLLYGGLPAALFLVLLTLYPRFAERRLAEYEP
jgi:ABC-2 type transport system permease protein